MAYDQVAQRYDDHFLPLSGKFAEVGHVEECSFISLVQFHSGGRVLDMASGTGRLSCAITSMFDEVYAIDVSEKMLSKQSQKAATFENIRLICADCLHMPFNVAFDSICCMGMFDYYCMNEVAAVLEECRRVIKRPGWMTFSVQDKNAEGIIEYVKNSSEELGVPICLYTKNEVVQLSRRVGLEIKKLQSAGLQLHIYGRW